MFPARMQALRDLQIAHGLDGVALVPGANLFYFTGLQKFLSERPCVMFLPVEDNPRLLLPDFEASDVEEHLTFDVEMCVYNDMRGHELAFRQVCQDLDLAGWRLGVEYTTMRVLERERIGAFSPRVMFIDAGCLFAELRMCKDAAEIEAMREAARINEQAFRNVTQSIRPGQTEKKIAAAYQIAALEAGSEGLAFDPIVVAGPNGALPHAYPGDRSLLSGEFVTLDCGVRYGGYYSDITRTFAIDSVGEELERIYETVRQANAAGRAFAHPGVTAQAVDRATRQVIADAGYGEYFIHRTGHGLGLEVHEPPYIVEGNDLVLRPGMIFTIEPGIYVPGLGGVRIEDNVVITETGCESLTNLPRELTTL